MARMVEPYTGTEFDVNPKNIEKREKAGWKLVDPAERVEVEDEAEEETEAEDDGEKPEETVETPAEKPGEGSTIAEIKAWAEANGVELPKKANKAEMLAAIG